MTQCDVCGNEVTDMREHKMNRCAPPNRVEQDDIQSINVWAEEFQHETISHTLVTYNYGTRSVCSCAFPSVKEQSND